VRLVAGRSAKGWPVDQSSEHRSDGTEREPQGGDLIIPVLATGLTLYYLATTAALVWEAKATGVFVGVVLLALCAVQFLRLGRRIASRGGCPSLGDLIVDDVNNRRRLGLLALVSLFIATVGWLGATLGLFLLLIGSMRVMGVRDARTLVAVALTTSAVVYLLLIVLLNTRLPRGPLERLLAGAAGLGA
jgi:hypothetical protein